MEKKDLKKKLSEVKKSIIANANDAHFMKNALDKALSLKGQLSVPSTPYDMGEVVKTWSGDTFEMGITTKGAYYRTYGGYLVYGASNQTSFYETIYDYVENHEEYEKLEGQVREDFELTLSAVSYVLSLNSFVFSDAAFLFEVAGSIVTFLREKSEQLLNEELQEETPELDEQFKQATLGLEELKKELDKE